jgi:uncharacterized membrane protein
MYIVGIALIIWYGITNFRKETPKRYVSIALAIIVVFVALSFSLSYIKYLVYGAYAWDLGIYMQSVYTAAYYHMMFYYTPELPPGSLFKTHVLPILFLLVPIYYLFPHAATLLLIQSLLIGGAALTLYMISKSLLKDDLASLLIMLAFLLNPGESGLFWFDFHVEAFIPLLYFLVVLFLVRRRWGLFIISVVLTLMIIEFMVYIIGMFVITLVIYMLRNKDIRTKSRVLIPIIVAIITAAWFIIVPHIKAYYNPAYRSSPFAAFNPGGLAGYGGSIFGFINYAITHTQAVISSFACCFPGKVDILVIPGAPTFASLLDFPWILPAVPFITLLLTSSYGYFGIQYYMYYVPLLNVAAVFGILSVSSRIRKFFVIAMLVVAILSFLVANAFSPFAWPNLYIVIGGLNSPSIHYLDVAVSLIPSNASVLTTNEIFPHVANRVNAYVAGLGCVPYSFILYLERVVNVSFDYILVPGVGCYQSLMYYALKHNYGLVVSAYGVYLFKKGYVGKPLVYVPLHMVIPSTGFYVASQASCFQDNRVPGGAVCYLPANVNIYAFWWGPSFILPSGSYVATVYLKIASPCNSTLFTIVVNNGTQTISRTIYCSDFPSPNTWVGIDVPFNVTSLTSSVLIQGLGLNPNRNTGIYFGYVVLRQVGG